MSKTYTVTLNDKVICQYHVIDIEHTKNLNKLKKGHFKVTAGINSVIDIQHQKRKQVTGIFTKRDISK